jgi:hypothetical protein
VGAGFYDRFWKALSRRSGGGRDMSGVKEEALKLIDGLPEETSWDDIIYQMCVRKEN